jgi:urease accessory protein
MLRAPHGNLAVTSGRQFAWMSGRSQERSADAPVATPAPQPRAARVGIAGATGSGKTRLLEQLLPRLCSRGVEFAIAPDGSLVDERPREGESASAERSAERASLHADELDQLFSGLELVLIESDQDEKDDQDDQDEQDERESSSQCRAFDHRVFVVDLATAAKLAHKANAGLVGADLLILNKLDLALYTRVDLPRLLTQLDSLREGRPTLLTSCATGQGLDAVLEHLIGALLSHR